MINLQPILETNQIQLLPLRDNDFEFLYQAASNPEIWEQHPNKLRYKREVFTTFFEGAIASNGAFKVIDKATNQVIGSTRFYEYDANRKTILIGYTFYRKEFWGKGVNQQVKTLMLNYIFKYVDRVEFHVGAQNIRSQMAMKKLGAVKIAAQQVTYFGEQSKLNFVYEIKRENWRENF